VVSLTLFWPCLLEGLNFLDLSWASDIGGDLPRFAMRRGGLRLFGLPLGL
jgi:hypothetical protein